MGGRWARLKRTLYFVQRNLFIWTINTFWIIYQIFPISAAWVPISPKIVSHSLSPETNQIPVLQHLVIKYHTCLSHKPSPPAAQPPRSLPQLMWHFLSFSQGVLGTRGTSSQGESCGLDGACRYCRPRLHQPAGE